MRTVYLNAAYFPSVELLSAVATAAILIYGGNQVLDGQRVTIGVLASFVFYLQSFFDPIQSLSQLYTTYQAGMAALDKIFELLDEEPDLGDKPDAIELPRAARRDRVRRRDASPTAATTRRSARSTCTSRPGRPWRWWAPPAPASPRSPSSWRASTTPTTGACWSTATTCAT